MSTPKYVYAVLKLSTEEVVLVTDSKNDVKDFMSYRPKDNYSIAKITNKDDIKRLKNMDLEGERFEGYLFSMSEFEYFSEYIGNINSTLMYDLDLKILNNLKYLKLCDEDKEIIYKAIDILKKKTEMIYGGPTEYDSVCDEGDVYHLDELVKRFIIETID